jgi:hypothetical protein
MANMSYCRIQNTVNDLDDVVFALESGDPMNPDDLARLPRLVELCKQLIEVSARAEVDID